MRGGITFDGQIMNLGHRVIESTAQSLSLPLVGTSITRSYEFLSKILVVSVEVGEDAVWHTICLELEN